MRPLVLAVPMIFFAALPAQAADPHAWPWASKMPPDPALVVLSKVNEVTAKVEGKLVKVMVKATAPQEGFSELALTPRIGDPKDRIFAFDARGRAPQKGADVETPVTIDVSYSGAPIDSFEVLEVFGKENCVGYSLKESKPVECASKSISQ